MAVLRRDVLASMELLDTYRKGHASLERSEPSLAAEAARIEQDIDLSYIQDNLGRQFAKSLEGLQRIRDIVDNLRNFSRLDEAEFKEADLNAGLQSTIEIIQHELKNKGVRLETDFQELPLVLCHPGKLNQVFLNLIANAVQACELGGVVSVRTRIEPPGAQSEESVEEAIVVDVADTGCGISPEHVSRIFDPFFTTKPVGQGTGLGLSVSYGIVRDHGGTIEVESEPGQGTTFHVRIPRLPPGA
jgi:signal transduction histidine kinase